MTDRLVEVADGFWNIRGSFKVAGLFDVGAQTSLVRLSSGDFVLLDAYTLAGDVQRAVLDHTDHGRTVRAVLCLHPFHTEHVRASAAQFPNAQLYGTRRHKACAPELPWQTLQTDDTKLHEQFGDDFSFSVPRGVDFIPENQAFHFASVLAFHKASGTLHVDDTLNFLDLPIVGGLKFHPTLRFVLQKRRGAADEFRAWGEELVALCSNVKRVCTAHARALPPPSITGAALADRVRELLAGVADLVDAHARRYG